MYTYPLAEATTREDDIWVALVLALEVVGAAEAEVLITTKSFQVNNQTPGLEKLLNIFFQLKEFTVEKRKKVYKSEDNLQNVWISLFCIENSL